MTEAEKSTLEKQSLCVTIWKVEATKEDPKC